MANTVLEQQSLRILATSDLHMHLSGHNYLTDQPDLTTGLVHTASLIDAARAEAAQSGADVLLFDNGDMLQGSALETLSPKDAVDHPMMRAFGLLGYDAIGLGNHDFDFGLATTLAVLDQAPCPVVCSNLSLATETGGRWPVVPSAVFKKGPQDAPIKIGVIGLVPPQTLVWNAHVLDGDVAIAEMMETARDQARLLRENGCDVIIALAHSGLSRTTPPSRENVAIDIAALADIDAVVAGHTHLQMPGAAHADYPHTDAQRGLIHGTPVVMPGSAGSHLGVIDLDMSLGSDRRWKITSTQSALLPIAQRTPDGQVKSLVSKHPGLTKALAPYHAKARATLNQPVGRIEHPLHSYFSLFGPDPSLSFVAAAQKNAARSLLPQAFADLPLISAVAPSRFGGRGGADHYIDIAPGEVSLRHAKALYAYPNDLRLLVANGAVLRDWLEMSARIFTQVQPGAQDTPLLVPDAAGHNFCVLHGLTYDIDLSAPPRFNEAGQIIDQTAQRIHNLCRDGRPLSATDRFVVVTNSYRANGGGNFQALKQADQLPTAPIPLQRIIIDYLASGAPGLPPHPRQTWRFTPVSGTSVRIETGPAARRFLPDLNWPGLRDLGIGAGGFLGLSLPL